MNKRKQLDVKLRYPTYKTIKQTHWTGPEYRIVCIAIKRCKYIIHGRKEYSNFGYPEYENWKLKRDDKCEVNNE